MFLRYITLEERVPVCWIFIPLLLQCSPTGPSCNFSSLERFFQHGVWDFVVKLVNISISTHSSSAFRYVGRSSLIQLEWFFPICQAIFLSSVFLRPAPWPCSWLWASRMHLWVLLIRSRGRHRTASPSTPPCVFVCLVECAQMSVPVIRLTSLSTKLKVLYSSVYHIKGGFFQNIFHV